MFMMVCSTIRRSFGGLLRLIGRFLSWTHGVAATEFALLFPMLLILVLGGYEVSKFVAASTRTTYLANGLVELVSQQTLEVSTRELDRIIELAPLMNPDILYQARVRNRSDFWNIAEVTVSSIKFVKDDDDCEDFCSYTPYLIFSYSRGGRRLSCGVVPIGNEPSQMPAKVVGEGSVVMVEVRIPYLNRFFGVLPANFQFYRKAYLRPRYVAMVKSDFDCSPV